mgnify:CR=1 FL=1
MQRYNEHKGDIDEKNRIISENNYQSQNNYRYGASGSQEYSDVEYEDYLDYTSYEEYLEDYLGDCGLVQGDSSLTHSSSWVSVDQPVEKSCNSNYKVI